MLRYQMFLTITGVVSSEIILVILEISENLLITHVNQLFPSPALQSDAIKKHALVFVL